MKGKGEGKQDARKIFERLQAARKAKIRYGRATLTIERSDSVLMTPLTQALRAHREGEMTEEDVAWVFVKERVIEHSPTFSWEGVELAKLLPRVVAVTTEPEIKADIPSKLVAELEAIEAREKEEWERARKRMKQAIPGVSQDLLKSINRSNEIARAMRPAYLDAFKAIRPKQMEALKAIQPGLNEQVMATIRPQLPQIYEAMRPRVKLANFGIDPKTYEAFVGLGRVDLSKQLGLTKQVLARNQDWRSVFQEVAEAARGADSPDIAKAVETTAEEATKDASEVDLSALSDTLTDLLREQERLADEQAKTNEKLDEMQASNSVSRQVVIGLSVTVIWTLIQLILAAYFGIYFPPTQPPSK